MSRRTVLVASVAMVAMAAALLGAEVLVRNRESRKPRSDMSLLYYRHDRLQRAFVHGADHHGRVHINRFGFRGAEIEARKAPGVTRIMAMGASVTFDPCVTDDNSWPVRLGHWLGVLSLGAEFEVINAGVPGYLMLDNIIRLEDEIYAFEPDVILLYAGHGTVSQDDVARSRAMANGDPAFDSPTPHEAPTAMPWDNWLRRHSLLYNKVMLRSSRRAQANRDAPTITQAQWESGIERAAEDFRRELTSFALIAKAEGARVVLAEMAVISDGRQASELDASERSIWQRTYQGPPEITLEGIRQSGLVQRAVSDSLGLTFVPSNEFGIAGQQNYCPDDPIHFNDSGSDMMGRKLAEFLLASGVVKPASP